MNLLNRILARIKGWFDAGPACPNCNETLTEEERKRGKFCFVCIPPYKRNPLGAPPIRPLGKSSRGGPS